MRGPKILILSLQTFECVICNTKEWTMSKSSSQFVYCGACNPNCFVPLCPVVTIKSWFSIENIFLDIVRYFIGISIHKQWKSIPRQPYIPCVNFNIVKLGALFGGHRIIEVQYWFCQSTGLLVNLYIRKLWMLFVEHETMEAQFWARPLENPRSKMSLGIECEIHTCSIKYYVHIL